MACSHHLLDPPQYPDVSGDSAQSQVQQAVSYLKSYNSKYSTFWLDIEGQWSSSKTSNQQFFENLVSEAQKLNQTVGIYTSESQWSVIMGDSYTKGSKFPLWYAHYDNVASFSDFKPFAGWTKPAMKQYSGDDEDCGINLDQNWAPTINY